MAEAPVCQAFDTYEEAERFVKVFAAANCISFVVSRATKGFGACELQDCGVKKIYWNNDIPTFKLGLKVRQCNYKFQQHRSMRRKKASNPYNAQTLEDLQEYKDLLNLTEDADRSDCCPAKLFIKEVLEFPDYKVSKITKRAKLRLSNRLKTDLVTNFRKIRTKKIFYCEIPRKEDHEGHNLGDVSCKYQKIENYLADEIKKLKDEGITDTAVVKHHLMDCMAAVTVLPVDKINGDFVAPCKDVYKQIHAAKRVTVGDSDTLDEVIVLNIPV